jgi:hypothetical protein
MYMTQEQVLHELNRQLEEICPLDRIDRQTIRILQERIQQMVRDPFDLSKSADLPSEWPSNDQGIHTETV